jgi:hypothetical protein
LNFLTLIEFDHFCFQVWLFVILDLHFISQMLADLNLIQLVTSLYLGLFVDFYLDSFKAEAFTAQKIVKVDQSFLFNFFRCN